MMSSKPKDVSFHEALNDPETRAEFIRRTLRRCLRVSSSSFADLQKLHALSKEFVKVILASTKKMPYGMRNIARETLNALKVRLWSLPREVAHRFRPGSRTNVMRCMLLRLGGSSTTATSILRLCPFSLLLLGIF